MTDSIIKGTGVSRANVEDFEVGDHLIWENGVEVIVNKNYSVRNAQTHRIVAPPPDNLQPITKETGNKFVQEWRLRCKEEFAEGMARGMNLPSGGAPEAWGKIGEKAVRILDKTETARGFAELASFVAKASGIFDAVADIEENENNRLASVAKGTAEGAISALLKHLKEKRDEDNVIDI